MTLGSAVLCSIQFHPLDRFQLYSTSPPSAESMKREPCSDTSVPSNDKHHVLLEQFLEAGVDWIIHLDTDELMHPAGSLELVSILYGDLWQIYLKMLTWSYFLTIVERDDVKEPFSEVSMFKKNYDHLTKEMYFGNYKEATRGNPNYFLTYGNGKSAARVQDHLRPNGALRWHNYMKSPKNACSACY
ncbi:hypothetical protein KY284_010561 [Solanum tuberosum]|nr:hypothetical protein KY284_010561 [Solanum tuberosum]